MYKIEKFTDKLLNNELYYTKLDSGLNVYVIPQTKFKKTIGMFGTKFGSVDNTFSIDNSEKIVIPDGVAHFLEHKLFEQEDSNALDLFSKIGMNSNAYTSYDHTVYYFETTKDIDKGIETLIKLVKTPYFTDENVEKEKGIINQEINMYRDDPNWQAYMTVIKGLYNNNPINIDIAGSAESISKITKETLYKCYETFYNLNNMFFVIVGNVDANETINLINTEINKYNNADVKKVVKYVDKDDDKTSENKEITKKMNVYMPIITYGFKLNPLIGIENLKRELVISIIESMYFSKLSKFYNDMYDKNILTIPLDLSYESGKTYSFAILTAQGREKEKIKSEISTYINEIISTKFDKELFEIIKREKYGNLVYSFDNIDTFWREVIQAEILDIPVFSAIDVLESITPNDIIETLNEIFEKSKQFMSIIE